LGENACELADIGQQLELAEAADIVEDSDAGRSRVTLPSEGKAPTKKQELFVAKTRDFT
jgi:hypothetical protein